MSRTGLAYGRCPEPRETAQRLAVTTARRLGVSNRPRLAATNRQDRLLAKPGLAEGLRHEPDDPRRPYSSPSNLGGKVIVYHGASCIYICVVGTLCEHLFARFPCDSWIRIFGTNPRKHLRGCDLTIAYLYIKIYIARVTRVRHILQEPRRCEDFPKGESG